MDDNYGTKTAVERLYNATGVFFKVERNEALGTAYIMHENGINVLVRLPEELLVNVLDFAQRCAALASRKTEYEQGLYDSY